MKLLILSSTLVLITLLFDLGNPDALRQGTEGFYLQVASEMHTQGNILTPLYMGAPHWSKPPLVFLLPQLFYSFEGFAGLFSSRLSILLFTILLTAIGAKKFSDLTNSKSSTLFLYFFSTVGFFKYSRIFMMEMPLVLLTFLTAIYFYSYLTKKVTKDLVWSVCWGALACQVKGPVSFAMLMPSFCLYGAYHFLVFKKSFFKEISIWFILTIIFSSGWFLYEYFIFGQDFIDYFFLRENLGKFSSKSYPIKNVFQGLVLYSLPWSLLIPALLWKFKSFGAEKLSKENSKFTIFLAICFSCFFTLWLIPQQRSHHYAMPAIPFLLALIYIECFSSVKYSLHIKKIFKSYISTFSILGLIIATFTFINQDQFKYSSTPTLILGIFLLIIILFLSFRKNAKHSHYFLSNLLLISVFWSLFIPNYFLPLIPQSVKEATMAFKNIGAAHRKPYFISTVLQRKVNVLGFTDITSHLKKPSSAVIVSESLFNALKKSSNYSILKEWEVWRRGVRVGEILRNLKAGTVKPMRSKMYLIKSQ